jgi:hypothetical protein
VGELGGVGVAVVSSMDTENVKNLYEVRWQWRPGSWFLLAHGRIFLCDMIFVVVFFSR